MNNSNKKFSNSSASQKEKLFRDASKIEAMWAGLDKDVDSELTVYTNGHDCRNVIKFPLNFVVY
jgi:hypothetical protein